MEKLLYQQDNFPVFQNRMFDSQVQARTCAQGNIRLVQNQLSGLIYNAAFSPKLVTYDAAYQNEQGHSQAFLLHLQRVADIVERLLGRDKLVEIGCGKAYFLELLQSRGCSIAGFDPTYEGLNPAVKSCRFASDINVSAKGIVLRHVLEHIMDPHDFLRQLRVVNGGGLIYIEVPCFDWTLANRAWFDLFYEHVNYFRLSDFSRMFGRIVECGHFFGGQYMYVVADLASLRDTMSEHFDQVSFPFDFLPSWATSDQPFGEFPRAVWGAASKGVIYSLLRQRVGRPVEVLIDINPGKWGKFIPGTGLKVMSPAEGMATISERDTICVMNSNYLDEIRLITGDRFNLIGVENDSSAPASA